MTMRRSPKKPEPPRKVDQKQMEKTLSQLHRLQLQVYELDSATKIPYKGSPVKKQIKQLAALHQNMLRPKKQNSLNISRKTIQQVFQTLNNNTPTNILPASVIRKHFSAIFHNDYEFQLISSNRPEITVDELYEFLNYSEYDNFDVDKEVFAMLDKSSTGFVDFAELDRLLEMFGYSAVSKEMLQKILGAGSKDISFDSFKKLMARVNEDNSG